MTAIHLTVEVYAGANIENSCNEAVELAKKTGVDVWFDFNGVRCLARSIDNPEKIVESWHESLARTSTYKTASDRTKP